MNAIVEMPIAEQFSRLPPHSLEAEMALLGSLIMSGTDRTVFAEVNVMLNRQSFYSTDHQIIYDACESLHRAGKPLDLLIVREELARRQLLMDIGGEEYLGAVAWSVPSTAHANHYAGIVRDRHVRRTLIQAGNMLVRRGFEPADDDNESARIAQDAVKHLAQVTHSRGRVGSQKLFDVLGEVRVQMEQGGVPLITTGFSDLDALAGGVGLGEMLLIGARPSMGKSTLAKQMGVRIARSGVPTLVISLEEGSHKIARNILAAETRIDNFRIRKSADLTPADFDQIDEGIIRLADTELYITDKTRRLDQIEAEAALMVSKHGIKAIIIDYLQRVHAPGKNDYERVSAASLGLSDLFKDLQVAGIVPVQLNRGVEQRQDKRPTMADLRDSGKIEQDADAIVLLHREDYYHTDDPSYTPDQTAELIVAKWRDGKRGATVRLQSNLRYQTFEDMPDQLSYRKGGFNPNDLPDF